MSGSTAADASSARFLPSFPLSLSSSSYSVIRGVVARVFWKHMAILCDWWHDRLTVSGFIYVLVIEPDEAVLRPRNPQFHEFGAVRRFFFLLDDNAFAVSPLFLHISSYLEMFY